MNATRLTLAAGASILEYAAEVSVHRRAMPAGTAKCHGLMQAHITTHPNLAAAMEASSPVIEVRSLVAECPSTAYAGPIRMLSTIIAARSTIFMVVFLAGRCWTAG
jgi:hypothetical protein